MNDTGDFSFDEPEGQGVMGGYGDPTALGAPPADDGMNPMGDSFNQVGDEMPTNQFDTNFDAGVEADEETDPKRYIQQLTGKLSQSLRSYNEGLPQPDADLSKYVAGMIIKQATEGLSSEDANDILKKVTDSGNEDDTDETFGESLERIDNLSPDAENDPKEPNRRKTDSARKRPFTPKSFNKH